MKKTVPYINNLKGNRAISMMTAYDYPSAKAVSEAEIDIILVGDSLAQVVLGHDDTLSVTIDEIDKNKVLVISDYGKGTLKNIPSLISEAKKYNKLILVDPKGNDFSRYKGANIITPNFLEFEGVVGKIKDEADLTKKGKPNGCQKGD